MDFRIFGIFVLSAVFNETIREFLRSVPVVYKFLQQFFTCFDSNILERSSASYDVPCL
jgi:hypothetical protein